MWSGLFKLLGVYSFLIWLCWPTNIIVLANIIEYDKSILEDAHLKAPERIKKYKYPVEVHQVITKDGFALEMHRMPRPGKLPVLLVHGLMESSATWLYLGPDHALAYQLYHRGYDIWMINVRGNRYSRKHVRYHPIMPKFWDFSFHEMGIYDLPASIDYVLNRTGFSELHYIGHSQGTTSFWVMGSERPEYMKKIKLMQALAPVAYFDHIPSPVIPLIVPFIPLLQRLYPIAGFSQFPIENDVWREFLYKICSFLLRNTCTYLYLLSYGFDEAQFNQTLLPVLSGHFPAGTSLKSLIHYLQLYKSGGFYKYNYDTPAENQWHYNMIRPPQYKLSNVNCKVALYYSQNDFLSGVKDVQRLRNILPNVVHDDLISYAKFNHIDFLFAKDIKSLLYYRIFEVMARVDSGLL